MRFKRLTNHLEKRRGSSRQVLVLALLAGLAVVCGCATPKEQGGSTSLEYNPETGYPIIGAPRWDH